jgi:hypothetical protein
MTLLPRSGFPRGCGGGFSRSVIFCAAYMRGRVCREAAFLRELLQKNGENH